MGFYAADGHCDFLYGAVQFGYRLSEPQRGQIMRLEDMRAGGVALQFFAAWIDTKLRVSPLHQCIAMIDADERMLEENPFLQRFTADFVPESGRIATVLAVEGGEAIEGSLAALRVLYRLGVRAMTLTWNENNELCGAAMARGNRGLTALGREAVDEMCRLGVAIDVSHASDRAIEDILSRATRPVFASHSNARAVHNAPRALADEHIRAIAAQGGVVGVNFYHEQLCAGGAACIDDIVRHIRHIVSTGGPGCCALGSDFDGMTKYPRDLQSSRHLPRLARALQAVGFRDEEIARIFYGNLRDYIARFV
ncbi:MAG: membrane dipeptidase [Clostridia bacterium]|nr:membrane dipeptidase [Clostridia bacterium]